MSARAVFLDRDGVINHAVVRNGKPYPPANLAETTLVDHALSSLQRLKDLDFLLIVVTNQPDVRRDLTSRESVEAIHRHLLAQLPLDDIAVCYHDDEDNCSCRKPRPGLLQEAAEKYHVALKHSFLIGDRWRDIDAGAAAGCRTILVDYGYNERSSERSPDVRVPSLQAATDWIVRQEVSS